jgi:hypothetical protein
MMSYKKRVLEDAKARLKELDAERSEIIAVIRALEPEPIPIVDAVAIEEWIINGKLTLAALAALIRDKKKVPQKSANADALLYTGRLIEEGRIEPAGKGTYKLVGTDSEADDISRLVAG